MLYGLTTLGRDDEARAFAQHEDNLMQLKTAVRLHDDARVLQLTKPDSSGYSAFARLVAAARLGDVQIARAALNKAGERLGGTAINDAMMALATHDTPARVAAYARVYAANKNAELGDPKNSWQTPIGEGYGAALLAAGKPADAETVFSAELKRYPNDPHLEWGLAEALTGAGQGRRRAARGLSVALGGRSRPHPCRPRMSRARAVTA